ncbi:ATP-binding response regulator [Anatilimnocola floriformis]|uniref:ATP-binding response regulator n=1 Tax=Anatilimnocola floriformis TaxID=2948575 RepID=UPI0020C52C03|nr:response regulator [Anatilimnocola floriformis]
MPTVLVVDDSAVDRKLAGGLLARGSDWNVVYATDGPTALAQIAASQPDIVVTDLVMPGMNGLELVAAIVQQYPQLPVVLMTGKGTEETSLQALQAGAASYVPKAALNHLLAQTVRDVFALRLAQLNQQKLMGCMQQGQLHFSLGNDADFIPPFINYVQNLLCSVGLCDESSVIRVCIAFEEALRNALFHGNLELTSQQRDGDSAVYQQLVSERRTSPPYSQRQLHVSIEVTPRSGTFVVRDEGPGFDPHTLPDPTDPENIERVSGRGLLLMKTFMDEVRYNVSGNEVTMIKRAPAEQQSQEIPA